MNDQFPKVEGLGILGESTGRSRAMKLGDLPMCQNLGLHDQASWSPEAEAYFEELKRQIAEATPQIAILVGYSHLHHQLAKYFKSLEMPVVLYEVTPQAASKGIPPSELGEVVNLAIGISVDGSELVREAKVPYFFIGSPHKDRVSRVAVSAESLGLDSKRKIVSLFPGGRREDLPKLFPLFWRLAQRLAQDASLQVVLSLADLAGREHELLVDGTAVLSLPEAAPERHNIQIMSGMNLELLSVSTFAITGIGAITIECGLMGLPFLPLTAAASASGPQAMLNQVLGRALVEEFSTSLPLDSLLDSALSLIRPGVQREKMLADLQAVARDLQGYAAENAVEYIGREVALWKQPASKKAKGPKTA